MMMHYDKDGLPISMLSWATLMGTESYRVVKQDTAADGSWVSTVWMGLNHSTVPGKLKIFETIVFSGNDHSNILEGRRYGTLKEALQGHEELVKIRNEAPRHHLRKLEP